MNAKVGFFVTVSHVNRRTNLGAGLDSRDLGDGYMSMVDGYKGEGLTKIAGTS